MQQGTVVYLLVAIIIVLIVVTLLVIWTSKQLRKSSGNRKREAVLQANEHEENRSKRRSADAIPEDEQDVQEPTVPSTVATEPVPDKQIVPDNVSAHDNTWEPPFANQPESANQSEHESLGRDGHRIEEILRDLEARVSFSSIDSSIPLAEHTPPLVIERVEAEQNLSALGEDEIVRLSAYEARSEEDSAQSPARSAWHADAMLPVDRHLDELPDWLLERLRGEAVLGWLVFQPDGFCPASDQVYDPVVVEQYAELVAVAVRSAETVGLESPTEITLRGAEGAIGVYPLLDLGLRDPGWIVIFFSEPALSANWSKGLENRNAGTDMLY